MIKIESALSKSFLILMVLFTILPVFAIFNLSLQPATALSTGISFSRNLNFHNYLDAWRMGNFGQLYLNSLGISLVIVPIATCFAVLGGFGFYYFNFRNKKYLFNFFLLGMTLPYEAIVIPLYYGLNSLGLLNTSWSVILPLLGGFMPFGIFWMRSYFSSLPNELAEAASIDGASSFQILLKIILPISKSAILSLSIFYYIWSWNHFILSMILIQDATRRTVTTGLTAFVGQYSQNLPLLCAGTMTVIAPTILFFIIFQRHTVKGILDGAVK